MPAAGPGRQEPSLGASSQMLSAWPKRQKTSHTASSRMLSTCLYHDPSAGAWDMCEEHRGMHENGVASREVLGSVLEGVPFEGRCDGVKYSNEVMKL